MRTPKPSFASTFLERVWDTFAKRHKALNHRGEFHVDVNTRFDDFEWIRLIHSRGSRRPVLIVELTEHGIVHVYVRSNTRVSRGKVLLRLEFLRPFDNPTRVLDAFESSLEILESSASDQAESLQDLRAAWEDLMPRIVDPE